jgi:Protein of unknown function (DUF3043)
VLSLFRRKPADAEADATPSTDAGADAAEDAADDAPIEPVFRSKAYTPSKKDLGKITPKRKAGGRRPSEPPPANRREALRRMRLKQRESRAEARAGMMAGKEEFLFPRDKGPDRALVRDVVDSRRNVASYFLLGALIVLIGSSQAMPPVVRYVADLLWAFLAVAVIVDSILLVRKVKRRLRERLPKEAVRRGTGFYAIMRSLSFRRMRMPAPRVKIGQAI